MKGLGVKIRVWVWGFRFEGFSFTRVGLAKKDFLRAASGLHEDKG